MSDGPQQDDHLGVVTELTAAGRQRRKRRLRLVAIIYVPLLLLGAALGFLADRFDWFPDSTDDSGSVLSWLGLGLVILGLAIGLWKYIRNRRSGATQAAWNSPLHDIGRRQRRELRAQVLGGEPIRPASSSLASQVAQAIIRDNRRLTPTLIATCFIIAGNGLSLSGPFWRVLTLALLLLLVGSILANRRHTKVAQDFLAEQPVAD